MESGSAVHDRASSDKNSASQEPNPSSSTNSTTLPRVGIFADQLWVISVIAITSTTLSTLATARTAPNTTRPGKSGSTSSSVPARPVTARTGRAGHTEVFAPTGYSNVAFPLPRFRFCRGRCPVLNWHPASLTEIHRKPSSRSGVRKTGWSSRPCTVAS